MSRLLREEKLANFRVAINARNTCTVEKFVRSFYDRKISDSVKNSFQQRTFNAERSIIR